MENGEIKEKIEQSDRILIGLGEEFDCVGMPDRDWRQSRGCGILEDAGMRWMIPEWNAFCSGKLDGGRPASVLGKLSALLEGKDYFVVSTAVNGRLYPGGDRVVMPCGSGLKKQCAAGCKTVLEDVTEADRAAFLSEFDALWEGQSPGYGQLGACPECGRALVLNNVYAENYNEGGYLEQWERYMKWLQGTLNRNLLVLELGVGLDFPTVIRWPFEKAVFYNQKAFLCRVHEKLYQLTKELSGKGCGISQNAIDWVEQL